MLRVANRGGRLSFLKVWQRWEPIAMHLWRVRPVRPGALLQFGVSAYRGHSTVLSDGTSVQTGCRILHLHLDNHLLASLSRAEGSNPWELVDVVRHDLEALAEEVASGRLGDVRAVRGVTVLARAATRAGFEVRPLPHNLRWALIRLLSALVVASYHPDGIREVDRGVPWPGEVWMSSRALLTRLQAEPLVDRSRAAIVAPLTG
jgi:hypothetical protein